MGANGAKALSAAAAAMAGLAACQPAATPDPTLSVPRYEGVESSRLDEEIVNLIVRMSGPATDDDLIAYSRCVAAQYALVRGYGFARHVRTNVQVEGSVRVADAVYTVSPTLPRGLQTIDTEVTVANCAELGIPTA